MAALAPSVQVFKLAVTNAWYAQPLMLEERRMCDTIEARILSREPPPQSVALHFRERLTVDEGRKAVWEDLARRNRIALCVGAWEADERL